MAPQLLYRVTNRPFPPPPPPTTTTTHSDPKEPPALHITPAILPGFQRHRVKGADYPGIIPSSVSPLTNSSLSAYYASNTTNQTTTQTQIESSVLGTLVSNLSSEDVRRLDLFEGNEYEKWVVRVRRVGVAGSDGEEEGEEGEEGEVQALTYVYTAGMERLESAEWDFETFKRDKLSWWVGLDEREW